MELSGTPRRSSVELHLGRVPSACQRPDPHAAFHRRHSVAAVGTHLLEDRAGGEAEHPEFHRKRRIRDSRARPQARAFPRSAALRCPVPRRSHSRSPAPWAGCRMSRGAPAARVRRLRDRGRERRLVGDECDRREALSITGLRGRASAPRAAPPMRRPPPFRGPKGSSR
jgi:hypothetical protein